MVLRYIEIFYWKFCIRRDISGWCPRTWQQELKELMSLKINIIYSANNYLFKLTIETVEKGVKYVQIKQ